MKIDLNNLTFMRFGSLSPVKQEGYKAVSDTFHQPPARHGIYAFVTGQKEKFLLGKHCFDQKMHIIVPKEETEHIIWRSEKVADYFEENFESWSDEECEKYREENEIAVKYKQPRIFKYTGELWHHLEVKRNELLKQHGKWNLTTFETFCVAFKKEMGRMKVYENKYGYRYSKDHLEVFIEKVK